MGGQSLTLTKLEAEYHDFVDWLRRHCPESCIGDAKRSCRVAIVAVCDFAALVKVVRVIQCEPTYRRRRGLSAGVWPVVADADAPPPAPRRRPHPVARRLCRLRTAGMRFLKAQLHLWEAGMLELERQRAC